jgi:hypothetical protein
MRNLLICIEIFRGLVRVNRVCRPPFGMEAQAKRFAWR